MIDTNQATITRLFQENMKRITLNAVRNSQMNYPKGSFIPIAISRING